MGDGSGSFLASVSIDTVLCIVLKMHTFFLGLH
uniref:Uncharacterized protein n=1 Tax=Anguilla anguilla TaxID=7936 RepID=A0A0E9VNM0_ANGAN